MPRHGRAEGAGVAGRCDRARAPIARPGGTVEARDVGARWRPSVHFSNHWRRQGQPLKKVQGRNRAAWRLSGVDCGSSAGQYAGGARGGKIDAARWALQSRLSGTRNHGRGHRCGPACGYPKHLPHRPRTGRSGVRALSHQGNGAGLHARLRCRRRGMPRGCLGIIARRRRRRACGDLDRRVGQCITRRNGFHCPTLGN